MLPRSSEYTHSPLIALPKPYWNLALKNTKVVLALLPFAQAVLAFLLLTKVALAFISPQPTMENLRSDESYKDLTLSNVTKGRSDACAQEGDSCLLPLSLHRA